MIKPNPRDLKYRFQTADDVAKYCLAMQRVYADYGSIENLFNTDSQSPIESALHAFKIIREKYLGENITHGLNFLFAMPGKSASKRLWMFLRWMIRADDVDLGLWKSYSPAHLSFPLDTHIHRMAVSLKIIAPNESGVKALGKIHEYFHKISPKDPVKYDFALTRLGIAHKCQYEISDRCASCAEREMCLFS
jgi:uncharacterized protein (TIGR02757 family)